jgi:hypothetical protein
MASKLQRRMTPSRWDNCPRLCFVSNCSQGKILLLNCLLDGGAYEFPRRGPQGSDFSLFDFYRAAPAVDLVLLINDSGKPLDIYSLYHIGLGVSDKAAVIESYFRAKANSAQIVKPP